VDRWENDRARCRDRHDVGRLRRVHYPGPIEPHDLGWAANLIDDAGIDDRGDRPSRGPLGVDDGTYDAGGSGLRRPLPDG